MFNLMLMDASEYQKVNAAIDQIRPYLEKDGGDVELVEITPDKVVRVRLLGACKTCDMSAMTLKAGIEEALKSAVPSVQKVEAVK